MDDTDLQILSHLQRNGRLTMVELGKLAFFYAHPLFSYRNILQLPALPDKAVPSR